ncbi:kinetochore protein Nuf2-like [Canna indica]|uniref:Kinetochore protein Nuf2-like n=1 Tax=Canna indica TaxID=4628 RepID=A0AAQ3L3N0_9LILI|nr:kinetochore protein Nuf2-like [Canna indica]
MSTFSSPELPPAEIVKALGQYGIASLEAQDLANPSCDLVSTIYSNFLSFADPIREESNSQIAFEALELLENPDNHLDAIRTFNLYRRVKDMLALIRFNSFTIRDLLKPDPKRTIHILSAVVNFIFYWEEKLNMLQPLVDQLAAYEEKKTEIVSKIAELNQLILDHEIARQREEPAVQQLDTEVKELRQTIQNYNKQQMSLKTAAKALKEKTDAISDKRALEEKKSHKVEVKNSERSAMQSVQEKTSTLEVYSKVLISFSNTRAHMYVYIKRCINSAKTLEKDVKSLKAKLSDERVSLISLEAKLVEKQGKAKQAEEHIKVAEKERDTRYADETQRLQTVRAEMEWNLQCLEPRERNVEAMVAKGDRLMSEAALVRETGKAKQQEIQSKFEEIEQEFRSYSEMVSSILQRREAVMEMEALQITNTL